MNDLPIRVALQRTIRGLEQVIPHEDTQDGDTSYPHLRWMTNNCMANIFNWPTDKISRWVGFVQGVLTVRGVITTQEERDRTRPIFHEAYEAMGFSKPETIERLDGHQIIDDLIQKD